MGGTRVDGVGVDVSVGISVGVDVCLGVRVETKGGSVTVGTAKEPHPRPLEISTIPERARHNRNKPSMITRSFPEILFNDSDPIAFSSLYWRKVFKKQVLINGGKQKNTT